MFNMDEFFKVAPPKFRVGEVVRRISFPAFRGVIEEIQTIQGHHSHLVRPHGDAPQWVEEDDLERCREVTGVFELLAEKSFAGREAFTRVVTHLKLHSQAKDHIYALGSTRTRFLAYQFKPLLKFLQSRNLRLLLADEVGLGKTVEAGLILTEMQARRMGLERVLVVPPAHLTVKWHQELADRFGLEFEIVDSKRIRRFLTDYRKKPERTRLRGIMSLQSFRSRALRELWEEVRPEFDMMIFDEAGRLRNRETQSFQSTHVAVGDAQAVLFLTATPVQTSSENLFNLLHLLDAEEFSYSELFEPRLSANRHVNRALRLLGNGDPGSRRACLAELRRVENGPVKARFLEDPKYRDVVKRLDGQEVRSSADLVRLRADLNSLNVLSHIMNRTRKVDVHTDQAQRRARVLRQSPGDIEKSFYGLVTGLCQRAYDKVGPGGASFGILQPQRQMASCMTAAARAFAAKARYDTEGSDLPTLEIDGEGASGKEGQTGPVWAAREDWSAWADRLRSEDSKWMALRDGLRQVWAERREEKVVIFAFFKGTVHYLSERLGEMGVENAVMTGDVPSDPFDQSRDERGRVLERFRDDKSVRVLLSSDVGSEGLDLQFAGVVVNYDLPWNPMTVEQRIGRIDRIGQTREEIHILNVSMADTIDDRILARLYERIGIFEASIGDLDAILGDIVSTLTRDLLSRRLTAEEQEQRIELAARAIEQCRLDLETVEKASSELVGLDSFFEEQINRARTLRRYVAGEDLVRYADDYLRQAFRPPVLSRAKSADVWQLRLRDDVRAFLRQHVVEDDPELRRFYQRATRGVVMVTADQELADRDKALELLTFHHPLIRAIAEEYGPGTTDLQPVSQLRLRDSSFPRGRYAWLLVLGHFEGFRTEKVLEPVVVRIGSDQPLPREEGERLLASALTHGTGIPGEDLLGSDAAAVTVTLKKESIRRQRACREAFELDTASLLAKRKASIQETGDRIERWLERSVAEHRSKGTQEAYIKGLETRIQNNRARVRDRLEKLEEKRALMVAWRDSAAGIIEVGHGSETAER